VLPLIRKIALFVPSSTCQKKSDLCNTGPRLFFNSTALETYQVIGPTKTINYGFAEFEGPQAVDSIKIGDRTLLEQTFLDAHHIRGEFSWYLDYDCVLGLAPYKTTPTIFHNLRALDVVQDLPSPFELLLRQGNLEHPIFSLTLPKPPREEYGHLRGGYLLIGQADPKYSQSEFVSIPIKPSSSDDGVWRAEVHRYSWDDTDEMRLPSASTIAFATNLPHIVLPGDWGNRIIDSFNQTRNLPCDRRPMMPRLKLMVGNVTLTLDGFDYTMEKFDDLSGQLICQLTLSNMPFYPGEIVLRNSFFEEYHAVFDVRQIQMKSER
jgi:aspartyl protease